MKITFILPVPAHAPFGGAKVVYEYANGLASLGHEVTVVHSPAPNLSIRALFIYASRGLGLRGGVGPRRWMAVHNNVSIRWVPSLNKYWIPRGDIVIATSWHTAEFAKDYPSNRGKKYYFVQDYEFYMSATPEIRTRMEATYCGPFKNIVISPACESMVKKCGGDVFAMIPNGLDHEKFSLRIQIESKDRRFLGFPVRPEKFKCTADAISVCEIIRKEFDSEKIQYWGFGANKPDNWPEWINFVERPSDDELIDWYNRSICFLVPSEYEGWGLPGSEAMCCGAALVSTENGGVNAYATDQINALLVSPGDIKGLADSVRNLLRDDNKRIEMACNAEKNIRNFTWKRSVFAMESLFIS